MILLTINDVGMPIPNDHRGIQLHCLTKNLPRFIDVLATVLEEEMEIQKIYLTARNKRT